MKLLKTIIFFFFGTLCVQTIKSEQFFRGLNISPEFVERWNSLQDWVALQYKQVDLKMPLKVADFSETNVLPNYKSMRDWLWRNFSPIHFREAPKTFTLENLHDRFWAEVIQWKLKQSTGQLERRINEELERLERETVLRRASTDAVLDFSR